MVRSRQSLFQHHSSRTSVLQCSAFFMVQLPHPYTTTGKTIALTTQTFVSKLISLLFNMLSRFVMLFILFMGFSKQDYWSGLPFPSPVDHILSKLSTTTHPSQVALQGMAPSFTELHKAVIINSMDMSLSKPREMVKDRGAWSAIVHGVIKSLHNLMTEQQLPQLITENAVVLGCL